MQDQHRRLIARLVSQPLVVQTCEAQAEALVQYLDAFRDWGVSLETAVSRYILDVEWGWLQGKPALAEW